MRGTRVLITGASGFIGRHLCQALKARGAHVIGLMRTPAAVDGCLAERHIADIADRERVRQVVSEARPELVVHLAAAKNRSVELAHYRAGYETDLIGSLNLIDSCIEQGGVARFLFLGAGEEYGCVPGPFEESAREAPVSAYGVTKLAVTELLQTLARSHGFPAVILRPSIAYGPLQGSEMFLPALITALLSGTRFAMTRGEQTRDYLFVDDVVEAILRAALAQGIAGEVINIGSGVALPIHAIARQAARLVGPHAEKLIDFGARPYRPGEAMDYRMSTRRAAELLQWQACVPLEEGLSRTIAHFRAAGTAAG